MNRARIVIGMAKAEQRNALKLLLARGNYQVIAETGDGTIALRYARSLNPDLVVAETDLPGISGFELSRALFEARAMPVLLITQEVFLHNSFEQIRAKQQPVSYATKPLTESNLFPAVENLLGYARYSQDLEAEIKNLQEKVEARKLVDRAKGILMEQLGVTEAEAYRRLQKQSMDKCLPMRKVAEAIILASDLNKG